MRTEWYEKLNEMDDAELIGVTEGKIPFFMSAKSTTTWSDVIIEAKAILRQRELSLTSKNTIQKRKEKEKEQKFAILYSLRQATSDFDSYVASTFKKGGIGVLFIDIDDFKGLNKRFNETVVDETILTPFHKMLSSICASRGSAYLQGGEEFLILLPNHSVEEVCIFGKRLCETIREEEFFVNGELVHITVSIGIALYPEHGDTLNDLIKHANTAEHQAKEKGKDRYEVYTVANS
jgi:diguanylate cyclase (GGDEF)-like protein